MRHHLALFCGHKHCGSGDIMFSVCDMISKDQITKEWSNIMGVRPSSQFTSLPILVVIDTVVVEL